MVNLPACLPQQCNLFCHNCSLFLIASFVFAFKYFVHAVVYSSIPLYVVCALFFSSNTESMFLYQYDHTVYKSHFLSLICQNLLNHPHFLNFFISFSGSTCSECYSNLFSPCLRCHEDFACLSVVFFNHCLQMQSTCSYVSINLNLINQAFIIIIIIIYSNLGCICIACRSF